MALNSHNPISGISPLATANITVHRCSKMDDFSRATGNLGLAEIPVTVICDLPTPLQMFAIDDRKAAMRGELRQSGHQLSPNFGHTLWLPVRQVQTAWVT